jgi:hypothetical protein
MTLRLTEWLVALGWARRWWPVEPRTDRLLEHVVACAAHVAVAFAAVAGGWCLALRGHATGALAWAAVAVLFAMAAQHVRRSGQRGTAAIGLARELVDDRRTTIALIRRMRQPTGEDTLFLPWLGEYGSFVLYWIRYVHFHGAARKTVCCARGDEVYFPSASGFVYDWTDPIPDARKVGTGCRGIAAEAQAELRRYLGAAYAGYRLESAGPMPLPASFAELTFPLTPALRRGLAVDVVLGCRRREFAPQRNWPHWTPLVERLKAEGLRVGVIGRQDDLPCADIRSWDYGDASAVVELLQECALYIGTDTGTSHLAAFCSTPAIIFRDPGPWPQVQHMAQSTRQYFQFLLRRWKHPDEVATAALAYLSRTRF